MPGAVMLPVLVMGFRLRCTATNVAYCGCEYQYLQWVHQPEFFNAITFLKGMLLL
jgi:hypothetical protein